MNLKPNHMERLCMRQVPSPSCHLPHPPSSKSRPCPYYPARQRRRHNSLSPRHDCLRRLPFKPTCQAADVAKFSSYNSAVTWAKNVSISGLQRVWGTSQYDQEITKLALPALASMVLDPVMTAVSTAFIGHLGTKCLAAVGLGSMAVNFTTFIFSFIIFLTTPKIADAVANKNPDQVSTTASASFWLAAVIGALCCAFNIVLAPQIIGALNPEPVVAEYALDFIRMRALGVPALLLMFAAAGTYRGLKDTSTPLYAAAVAAAVTLLLNVTFLYGLGWGVAGAGLASSIAQWTSTVVLWWMLVNKGLVQPQHLMRPPPFSEVWPMVEQGGMLMGRVVISFGLVIYASALCVKAGAATAASFEVIRHVWLVSVQGFECLNVACQAMCASFLGSKDLHQARACMLRVLHLGVAVGAVLALLVWSLRMPLVGLFTHDAAVIAEVLRALPLICLFFPLDAAAAIMDGALFAARQTAFLSWIQIAASVVQYGALLYVMSHGMVETLWIWAVLKMVTVARLLAGLHRNLISPRSGYYLRPPPPQAEPPPSTAAFALG